jgi:hypothetical protein
LACAGFTEWAMDGHGAMGPSQKAIENDHLWLIYLVKMVISHSFWYVYQAG